MVHIYRKLLFKGEKFLGAHTLNIVVDDKAAVLEEEEKTNAHYKRMGAGFSCRLLYKEQVKRITPSNHVQLTLF